MSYILINSVPANTRLRPNAGSMLVHSLWHVLHCIALRYIILHCIHLDWLITEQTSLDLLSDLKMSFICLARMVICAPVTKPWCSDVRAGVSWKVLPQSDKVLRI